MKIAGHYIAETEIVGIGPLMVEYSKDPAILQIYGTRRYYFKLHLRQQSIKIYSDFFDTNGHDDERAKTHQAISINFRTEYQESVSRVLLYLKIQ